MLPIDKTSRYASVAKLRNRPCFIIVALVIASLCAAFFAWYAPKLKDEQDYARYAAPKENDLIRATGKITRVSDHIPYLEIRLDNDRDLLATFLVFPQRGSHNIYVRDMGAFDPRKLASLANCEHAEFEFYPIQNSLISYWIYALRCDGVEMLGYSDTMRYLALRKP
jgi:hypothetical protein